MACKYIFNGIEYKDKQTFIEEFIKPNFINQPKTLRLQELQQPDFLKFIRKDKEYLKSQGLTDQEVDFLNLLFAGEEKWIGFFIKSVIQDAVKKGYEKVLFPTGNTASKVEGHTTLEEFKKEKEDRIKELEKEQYKLDSNLEQGLYGMDTSDYELRSNKILEEIDTLEKELERVETEGFGALKPIYNFYENTVTNILKKQGFNPVVVTDEYGNTWNEIDISNIPEALIKNIRLSAPNIKYTGDLAIEEKIMEAFETHPDKYTGKSVIGRFFQQLRDWIKHFLPNQSKIGEWFDSIHRGDYRNQEFSSDSASDIKYQQSENNDLYRIEPSEALINEGLTVVNKRQDNIQRGLPEEYRKELETIEDVNSVFNKGLYDILSKKIGEDTTLSLGRPSRFLRAAGFPDLPIQVKAGTLIQKSKDPNHPFDLFDIRNLVQKLQYPIAVFDSNRNQNLNIFTEISNPKGENYLISVQLERFDDGLRINSIRSIYPRRKQSDGGILDWVSEDDLLRFVHKQKFLNWLNTRGYDTSAMLRRVQEAIKVVNNFHNPLPNYEIYYALKDAQENPLNYTEDFLYQEAGLSKEQTPLDFIKLYLPDNKQVDKFFRANTTLSMEFTHADSQFDPSTNTVYIGLNELYNASKATGIPFRDVVRIFTMHELAHAGFYYGVETGNNDAFLNEMRNIVLAYHKEHPFEDVLRQGYVDDNGIPYSLKDIHEFGADTFSNPYFQEYIKSIPAGSQSVWDRIINFFRNLLGLDIKDSVYDKVVDYINSNRIQRDNLIGSLTPERQEMTLTYRGNPKTYTQVAFEFFTSKLPEQNVQEIFQKFPSAIAKVRKELDVVTNEKQRQQIKTLLNAYNEVKDNEKMIGVYINMLTTSMKLAKDLNDQMIAANQLKDDRKKIEVLHSIYMAAKGLRFITPFVNKVVTLMEVNQPSAEVSGFISNLRNVVGIESATKQKFIALAFPAIRAFLSSLNTAHPIYQELDKELQKYREQLENPSITASDKKYYEMKVKQVEDKILLLPVPPTFDKILAGEYTDASWVEMQMEAISMNSHPLIQTVYNLLKDIDIELSQEMIAVDNRHQTALTLLRKEAGSSVQDTDKAFQPIMDRVKWVKEVKENEDGSLSFVYMDRKTLLSSYDMTYLQKAVEYEQAKQYYIDKFYEARRNKDEVLEDKYHELYGKSLRDQQQFFRENGEMKYKEEVYQMYDLLDKDILYTDEQGKTHTTSLRRERGDIFERITNLEDSIASATSPEEYQQGQDMLKELHIELQELKSPYTVQGTEKTGLEKDIADVARAFSEARKKYGKYVITEQGQQRYEQEKKDIEQRFQQQKITKEQHDALIKELDATEVSEEFMNDYHALFELLEEELSTLTAIPEVAAILQGIDRTKIKEGYRKIKQLTQSFRDNDGVIDGILFSKVRPELVKEIKSIQEELEKLTNNTTKLKGLSLSDNLHMKELLDKKEGRTPEEQEELNELTAEKIYKEKVYADNKAVIDAYSNTIKSISKLMSSTPSSYYLEEKENQLSILMQQQREELQKTIPFIDSLQGGEYFKKNGKWYRLEGEENGERIVEEIKDEPNLSATDKIVDEVAKKQAEQKLSQSDWWKANHYTTYRYQQDEGYVATEVPIYIWMHSTPTDAKFIRTMPAFRFRSYQIDSSWENPNHREILPFIPVNKKGKYENSRYKALQQATDVKSIAYRNYLEFARKEYYQYQENYPPNARMGDLLPGIARTHDEQKWDTVKKTLSTNTWRNIFKLGTTQNDEDTQLLTGGSQKRVDEEHRNLPIRFTGKMDASMQSSNIAGMLLMFALGSKRYQKTAVMQPILETIRTITDELPVQEKLSMASKFSLPNLWAAIKHDNQQLNRNKSTKASNLSQTMNHVLDTLMYGQYKNEAVSSVMGMQVDWHKVSGTLKGIASAASFNLNPFLAIKNTGAAKVAGFINSNISKGYYTKTQLAKASAKTSSLMSSYLHDYVRVGNKTLIGQKLQYFQVLQGAVYNEYGKKTQWTAFNDAHSLLTILKNVSEAELQVSQFLAMAMANPVSINGKSVPFDEAFEINKEGILAPKEGAAINGTPLNQEHIKSFIKKLSYVNILINGAYREDERNMMQKSVLGNLAFYLNGWLLPGLRNRFGGQQYNINGDIIARGYYNQAFRFAKELIIYRQGLNKQWQDLSLEERGRVMRFIKEISTVVAGMILIAALGGGDSKKDLAKNEPYYNYLLALAIAVKSENETFIPVPGMGLNEFTRKVNSPFAAMRQLTVLAKMFQNAVDFAVGDSDAYYKTTSYRDGFHDKGDPKIVANFLKLIGLTNIQLSPLERVQNQQRMQIIR